MKYIVVDDEPIIRTGLKKIIHMANLGYEFCDEAADGSEAISKILEKQPELVVLDIKMPEFTGIEVAKIVRDKGYQGKIIILSGFSDFSYAQSAIKYGIEAYLLKPIEEDDLIDILKSVKEKIENENIIKIYDKKDEKETRTMIFKHVLSGMNNEDYQRLKQYFLKFNGPYLLVLFDYSNYQDIDLHHEIKKLYIKFNNLKLDLIKIGKNIVVFINGADSIKELEHSLTLDINKQKSNIKEDSYCIISDIFQNIHRMQDVYHKLLNISYKKFFYDEGNRIIYHKKIYDNELLNKKNQYSPIKFIEDIYDGIIKNDKYIIDKNIKEFYHKLQSKDYTVEQTLHIIINSVIQIKTMLNRTYIKDIMDIEDTILINEICACTTLFEIFNQIKDRFYKFCDYVNNFDESDVIERIINFINMHYNEDLKLENIADFFGYNSAYLGRLFANKVGISCKNYIENKRLDIAIDMLINTDLKIPDISEQCGYRNVEYFYRKFKNYTKFTPGSYREKYKVDTL